MRAGDLRHPVTIMTSTQVADGMGSFTETDSIFARTRAAIWPISANERTKDSKVTMEISHRVRIRYQSGVLSGMRIIHNSRTLNIVSIVNHDERNIMLDLLCREDV